MKIIIFDKETKKFLTFTNVINLATEETPFGYDLMIEKEFENCCYFFSLDRYKLISVNVINGGDK